MALITPKVAESFQNDIGRGIIRIDSKAKKELGVATGDIVRLSGKKAALAMVWQAHPEDEGLEMIRMDGILRQNAGVGLGDRVKVEPVQAKEAKKIVLAPREQVRFSPGFDQYVKKRLVGKPVLKGNLLPVGIFGTSIPLIVSQVFPQGPVIIGEKTELKIVLEPVKDLEAIPNVTYDDVGGLKDAIQKLREMVELPLRHPEIFERLGIDPPKGVLLYGSPGTGKTLMAKAVANESDANFYYIGGPEVVSKFVGESEERLRKIFQEAQENAPSIIFIDEIDAIAPKRSEVLGEVEKRLVSQLLTLLDGLKARGELIIIGATNREDAIDPALRRPGRFDREIEIGVPDVKGRLEILHIHVRNMPLDKDVSLDELAGITHGYTGADLSLLTKEAAIKALRRVLPEIDLRQDFIAPEILDKLKVTRDDFFNGLREIMPSALREVFVERPTTKWEDIGGLESVKKELREAVELPLKSPELFERMGVRPLKGILLYGPPGTGKTLLAKAVAHETEANFISISGAQVLSKYVGESEKTVREIFKKARMAAPCILFVDEIDAIAPFRSGSGGDGTRVTERLVDTFLTEIDGLKSLKNVVVIGASVMGDTPILIKDYNGPRLLDIGEFVDSYYEEDEEGVEKPVYGVESLGFEKRKDKRKNGLRFGQSSFKSIRGVYRHKVKEIYEIRFLGGTIRATGSHSVFVRTKRGIEPKRVSDLKVGQYLVDIPYTVRTNNKVREVRDHDFKNDISLELPLFEFDENLEEAYEFAIASKLSQAETASRIGVTQTTVSNWMHGSLPRGLSKKYFKHALQEKVKVTPSLMRLFGFYASEGYARKELDFCFGIDEKNLVSDLKGSMKEVFGLEPDRVRTITKNAVNVTYHSSPLARFFIRHVGKGAKNKHLPPFLFEAPREYFLEFFKAYVQGDGYIAKDGKLQVTSVSKRLIIELNWLCRMHGIKSYVGTFIVKAGRKINGGKPLKETTAYRLGIGKSGNPFLKNTGRQLVKRSVIKEIKKIAHECYVYDLCGCDNEAFFGGDTPILLHNTNRPDILDSALLRAGRFDRIIEIARPDEAARLAIMKIHTARMPLDSDVSLPEIARLADGYTGADMENVVREAGMSAIREGAKKVRSKHFQAALKQVMPITRKEHLEHIEKFKNSSLMYR